MTMAIKKDTWINTKFKKYIHIDQKTIKEQPGWL